MNKNHSLAIAVGAGTVGSVLAYLGYSFYKNTTVSTKKEYVAKEYVRNDSGSPENVKIKRKKSRLQLFYTPDGVGYTEVDDDTAEQLSDVTSTITPPNNNEKGEKIDKIFLNHLEEVEPEKEVSKQTVQENTSVENEDSDGFKESTTPKEIEEAVLTELAKEASSWGQFWKDSYNEHDYSDSGDSIDMNADMN
tara:strand:+ start:425 stop:1003 length:579 start_codon:yes stop_codon:yes gene_type:complete